MNLDSYQKAVVDWRKGEALVAAGAGSGKTTVLVQRVAALVRAGARPESIITLVYNRAAGEALRQRLATELGSVAQRCVAVTFHAYALKVLQRWAPRAYQADRLIGTSEGPNGSRLVREAMGAIGVSEGEPSDYQRASEQIREALVDLASPRAAEQVMTLRIAAGSAAVATQLVRFANAYQTVKQAEKAIDFTDLLCDVAREIQASTLRAEALRVYRHVQTDEAQDSNPVRWLLATHLASGGGVESFVNVGDVRQSIYGFASARPELFRERLQHAKLLTLPTNRRSGRVIVDLGNRIADGREWNLGGACAALTAKGEGHVHLHSANGPSSEAAFVAEEIQAQIEHGLPLAVDGKMSYACLVRTNAQAIPLEVALLSAGLPVRVLGSAKGIWGTSLGRDVLAYLRGAEGKPHEDIARISNRPVRFLRRQVLQKAIYRAKLSAGKVSVIDALYDTGDRAAATFADDLRGLGTLAWENRCKRVLELLVDDARQRATVASQAVEAAATPDADKLATYAMLVSAAVAARSLARIVSQMRMVEAMRKKDAVEVSTIHKAKGLEWQTVFVCGVTEGVLPHGKSTDIEEERRLFYVACTRAKESLFVSTWSCPPGCQLHPTCHHPSRFLSDAGMWANVKSSDVNDMPSSSYIEP